MFVSALSLFTSCSTVMAQKKSDADILITIKREACFGEQRHRISEDRVNKLIKAFERVKYFSSKDKYEVDENGMRVMDQPRTTTSTSLNGKQKRVVDCYCAPKELVELEDLIDKLAGPYEYIGPL